MSLLRKRNYKYAFIVIVLTGLYVFKLHQFLLSQSTSQIINSSIQGDGGSNVFVPSAPRTERPDWRTKEIQRLGDLVQRRLRYLQNPKDCENAKKIMCNFTRGAGYGSQMNDWMFCLIVAYVTERTLIIESKGWLYAREGLETVFLSLSKNCTSTKNQTVTRINDLTKIPSIKGVVQLNRNFNTLKRPLYLPMSIPEDLADEIIRVHKNPSGWWVGQFLVYLTRQNQSLKRFMEENIRKLGFSHPIVGIHVRRTDKNKEAKYHDIGEYMTHVEKWYDSYERRHGAVQRSVFLASDEPTVINKAKKRFPNYTFVHNVNASEIAQSWSTRFSVSSLHGILLDLQVLSMCDFVVCTLSSNVGTLTYESLHAIHWDAPDRIKSLDIEFAFQYHLYEKDTIRQHRNRGETLLRDISNPLRISVTRDNKKIRVKMPTYKEVPRQI